MDFRSILAVVDGGAESRNVLNTALELGRRYDAATALLQVLPPETNVMLPMIEDAPTSVVSELIDDIKRNNARRRDNFDDLYKETVIDTGLPVIQAGDVITAHHFSVAKLTVFGHENREIAERGRLFDLVVIGMPDDDSGGLESAALEAAMLETARPLLITCRYPRPVIGGHVTIAWDGSREAAQSIRNALPLLQSAKDVEVVHVIEDEKSNVDPEDIRKYLSLHGIEARTRSVVAPHNRVAETLLDAARTNGHALLVMGAYGAGAAIEYMFGGVTRDVLSAMDVPLLLSH